MPNVVLMLVHFALYLLSAVEIAMMVRAILSFLMPDGQGALIGFLYVVTEPLISVVRRVFDRFGWESRGIFDIPFFATYFVIMILKAVLRAML
ncbi:MAG: YggT family protein [Clostridia bacterium]|nr:YggT family protein [Clostridia bacterium]